MKEKERKQAIATLLEEKVKLLGRIAELEELTKPIAPENSIGRISRMDAINNKSVNEAALRTAKAKYKNVALALEKTDQPDFGVCRRCSKPIPIQRLLILPGSPFCVQCASR